MPRIFYRLYQSRNAKLRSLRQYLWNSRALGARRRNTYLVEQLENRYLLSADAAPFALSAELLNDELVVEQLVDTGLAEASNQDKLQLVRQHDYDLKTADQEADADTLPSAAPETRVDHAATAANVEDVKPDGDEALTEQASEVTSSIRFVQQLNGHQFVVIDRSVEDFQALLETFMGDAGADLEWHTETTANGDVLVADWFNQNATPNAATITSTDTDDESVDPAIAVPETRSAADRVTVVLLDEQGDGVEQLGEILAAYEDISALHVLSHGAAGALRLGTASLGSTSLDRYRSQLEGWGRALKGDGDILLYGCNVAQDDICISSVDRLAGVTQADIAAADSIASRFIAGDWILESEAGYVTQALDVMAPEELAFAANEPRYQGLLVDVPTQNVESVSQVVFVDAGIDNYESLLDTMLPQTDGQAGKALTPVVEIVVLDSNGDGIVQISDYLAGREDISSVHILSHGASGSLRLGNTDLSTASLGAYAEQLRGWRSALTSTADILLYACNLAGDEQGVSLVRNLAALTGADLAASDDPTGAAVLGGDWDLESIVGDIESPSITQILDVSPFAAVLAAPVPVAPGTGIFADRDADFLKPDGRIDLALLQSTAKITWTINSDTILLEAENNDGKLEIKRNAAEANLLEASANGQNDFIFKSNSQFSGKIVGNGDKTTVSFTPNLDNPDELFTSRRVSAKITADLSDPNYVVRYGKVSLELENIGKLIGGKGNDKFTGSLDESSILTGGRGKDELKGGDFEDELYGGEGADTLVGGEDADKLYGGDGADLFYGDAKLSGGPGTDPVLGDDRLEGGGGDDTYYFFDKWGEDTIVESKGGILSEGGGIDTLDLSAVNYGLELEVGGATNFIEIEGTPPGQNFPDKVLGSEWIESIELGRGDNRITIADNFVEKLSLNETGYSLVNKKYVLSIDNNFEPAQPGAFPTAVLDLSAIQRAATITIEGILDAPLGAFKNKVTVEFKKSLLETFKDIPKLVVYNVGEVIGTAGDDTFTVKGDFNIRSLNGGVGNDDFELASLQLTQAKLDQILASIDGGGGADGVELDGRIDPGNGQIRILSQLDADEYQVNYPGDPHGILVSVEELLARKIEYFEKADGDVYLLGNNEGNRQKLPSDPFNRPDTSLRTGSGNDRIEGRDGNDDLFGGKGNDTLVGGAGNDNLFGEKGKDTFIFEGNNWGHDKIESDKSENKEDILDFTRVDADMTFSFAGGKIEAGTGNWKRDTTLGTFPRAVGKWVKVDGSDPAPAEVDAFKQTYSSVTAEVAKTFLSLPSSNNRIAQVNINGDIKNTFYFGNDWNATKIVVNNADPDSPKELILDFSAVTEKLEFRIIGDNKIEVVNLGVRTPINTIKDVAGRAQSIVIEGVHKNTNIISGRYENTLNPRSDADNNYYTYDGRIELLKGIQWQRVPFTERSIPSPIQTGIEHGINFADKIGKVPKQVGADLKELVKDLPPVFGGDDQSRTQGLKDWATTLKQNATGITNSFDLSEIPYDPTAGGRLVESIPGFTEILLQGDSSLPAGKANIKNINLGSGINIATGTQFDNQFSVSKGRVGAHFFNGKAGADSYTFGNQWGFGAILEYPDVLEGVLPEALDTIDFSGMIGADVVVDIYKISSTDFLDGLAGIFDDIPEGIGDGTIFQDALSTNILIAYAFEGGFRGQGNTVLPTNVLFANDIESLVGPNLGSLTLNFIGEAGLRGTVKAGTLGDVILDYSQYSAPVITALDYGGAALTKAGAQSQALEAFTGLFDFGAVTDAITGAVFPQVSTTGSATGIQGHRLGGLTTIIDAVADGNPAGDLLKNYAVSGVSKVIGSSQADTFDLRVGDVPIIGDVPGALGFLASTSSIIYEFGVGDRFITPLGSLPAAASILDMSRFNGNAIVDLETGDASGSGENWSFGNANAIDTVINNGFNDEFTAGDKSVSFRFKEGWGNDKISFASNKNSQRLQFEKTTGATTFLLAKKDGNDVVVGEYAGTYALGITVDIANALNSLRLVGAGGGGSPSITYGNNVKLEPEVKGLSSTDTPLISAGTALLATIVDADVPPLVIEALALFANKTLRLADENGVVRDVNLSFADETIDGVLVRKLVTDDDQVLVDSSRLQVVIADLPDQQVSTRLQNGQVILDASAGDHGWFIDDTPATADDLDTEKVDLLSVLLHEIAQQLRIDPVGPATALMDSAISIGSRIVVPADLGTADTDSQFLLTPLEVDSLPDGAIVDVATLSDLLNAAITNWSAQVFSVVGNDTASPLGALIGTQLAVADLEGQLLARVEADGTITLDRTAAGFGWFVDGSPPTADDLEAGRIDMLTVLMHELGHKLSLQHDTAPDALMNDSLAAGERRDIPGGILSIVTIDSSDQAKLVEGLGAFANVAEGFGERMDQLFDATPIPFVDISLNSLLGIDVGAQDRLRAAAELIQSEVAGLFASLAPGETVTTADIEALADTSSSDIEFTLERAANNDPASFRAIVDLTPGGPVSQGLDLSALTIGSTELNLGIDTDFALEIDSGLKLDFTFGLTNAGVFYVDSPGLSADLSISSGAEPFDLEFRLGPVGLGVVDGNIGLDASMKLGSNQRLSYNQLLAGALDPLALDPSLSGAYEINLPVALTGALAGVNAESALISGSGALPTGLGDLASFVSNLDINFENFDQLFQFNGISLDMLLDALSSGLDALIADDSILYDTIPGLNDSLAGLIGGGTDFLEDIKTQIDDLRNDDGQTLNTLEDALNGIFNGIFGAGTDAISIIYADSILRLDIAFEKALATLEKSFDLDLDEYIDDLGLPEEIKQAAAGALAIEGDDVTLFTDITAGMNFGIGLDLSNILAPPVAFIADDASLFVQLEAGVEDPFSLNAAIDLSPLGLGKVGFGVEDGTAEINLLAEFGIPENADDSGLYQLGVGGFPSPEFELSGDIDIELPLMLGSLPVGGSEDDLDGDGLGEHVLAFDGSFSGGVFDIVTTAPNLADLFSLSAMLNDPQLILDGLEGMFDGIRGQIDDNVDQLQLPLVGGQLAGASGFVTSLEEKLLGKANSDGKYYNGATDASGYLGTLGGYLQNAIDNDLSTFEAIIDTVREELYKAFGGTAGLLKYTVTNPDGSIEYKDVASADDIQLKSTGSGIQFNILLAGEVFPEQSIGIDFKAAFPGFSLETDEDAAIKLNMDYVFGLGFGLDANAGLFVDTSGATEAGEELVLNLDVTIPDGTEIAARLAFLQATLKEHVDGKESGLFGQLSLDLQDDGGDGMWTVFNPFGTGAVTEGLTVEARLLALAEANFDASVKVESRDLSLPEITTMISYNQTFADITLNSGSGLNADFSGGAEFVFEDVSLNLGEAISGFVGPVFEKVGDILLPTKPLIDLLTAEIDLQVTDPFTLLDFAAVFLKSDDASKPNGKTATEKLASIKKAVAAIDSAIGFIETINAFPDDEELIINFGSFVFGGDQLGDKPPEIDPNAGQQPDLGQGSAQAQNVVGKFKEPGSFRFPILSDPASVFGLLLGREVDLFIYDLPALSMDFAIRKSIPIFPGLNAVISGGIEATTDFAFGFDSGGLQSWADGNFTNAELIFDGFFVSDVDENGVDVAEATLLATISAGLSLGIGGLIEAGVEGGIEAEINFNLADLPDDLSVEPEFFEYDGKLRASEIATRLAQSPLCLFDTQGELRAFLEAFLWVGLDLGIFGEITLFSARERFVNEVIAKFDFSCPVPQADVAYLDESTGTLWVRYIDGVERDFLEAPGQPDEKRVNFSIDVKPKTNPKAGEEGVEFLTVTGNGFSEFFDPGKVQRINVLGSNAVDDKPDDEKELSDEIFISDRVDADIFVDGRGGDDIITVSSSFENRSREIRGGAGNDSIIGSIAIDLIKGDAGDDIVIGGGGADRLYGNAGEDVIIGGDEDDEIWGGDDRDRIFAGGGEDVIRGGTGNDFIDGQGGDDTIYGVSETSSDNNTLIVEGKVNGDILKGGAGDDIIVGGNADDSIFGGESGADGDSLAGGAGNDTFTWRVGDGQHEIEGNGGTNDSVRMLGHHIDDRGFAVSLPDKISAADTVEVSGVGSDAVVDWVSGAGTTQQQAVQLKLIGIESLDIDTAGGSDDILFHDLQSTTLAYVSAGVGGVRGTEDKTIDGDVYRVTTLSDDQNFDRIRILGEDGEDNFVMRSGVTGELPDGKTEAEGVFPSLQIDHGSIASGGLQFNLFQLTKGLDQVVVDAGAESDFVSAEEVTNRLVDDLRLLGGGGDDRLIGSDFAETIIGGIGADRITGARGEDLFAHEEYPEAANERIEGELIIDTLVERRNENFYLIGEVLTIIDSLLEDDPLGGEEEQLNGIFETVDFSAGGGGKVNVFTLTNWTGNAVLDGAGRGDTYNLNLAQNTAGANFININDTGGSGGQDTLVYIGSDLTDLIQLDTVYESARDPLRQFSQDRWNDPRYGEYDAATGGDGLIIAHFGAALAGYTKKDIDDTDSLFEVGVSSLLNSTDYQVLNYSTVEDVTVFGGMGDDVFISDDTAAEINLYGNEGDDQFYVGSILKVEDVLVEGQEITVVTEVTNGTTFEMNVYGGDDDDYFEVSHNSAAINLFGDNGDDTFFIKALLTLDEKGDTADLASEKTTVNAGLTEESYPEDDERDDTREVDVDALVYVENANVSIDGGAGFDSVAVVGTALSDTFYVYYEYLDAEGENLVAEDTPGAQVVQRIYGAGVKLKQLTNIERLVLLTGAGDDRVYINGVDLGPNSDMVINLGSGSDEVILGHNPIDFDLNFPKQNRIDYAEQDTYQIGEAYRTLVPYFSWGKLVFGLENGDPSLVSYTVRTPALREDRTSPGDKTLAKIQSPLTIVGGLGIVDRLTINNQGGPESLQLADTVLLKKQITTDDTQINFPEHASVVVGAPDGPVVTDLLNGPIAESNEQVRENMADFLRNHILFQDKYVNTNLLNELQALSGDIREQLTLPADISYAVFQDTKVPGSAEISTAKDQLIEFLGGSGFTPIFKPPYVTPDGNIYEELGMIFNAETNQQLNFESENKTIKVDGIEYRQTIGISLLSAKKSVFSVGAGYIGPSSVSELDRDRLNTVSYTTLDNASVTNLFFEGFDEVEVNLNETAENRLFLDNTLYEGLLTVNDGVNGDEFIVHSSSAQTFLNGRSGENFYSIGDGTVDAITGELFIVGGDGGDSIVVNSEDLDRKADVVFDKTYLKHQFEQKKLNKISNLLGLGDADEGATAITTQEQLEQSPDSVNTALVSENEALDIALRNQTARDIQQIIEASSFVDFAPAVALASQGYAPELEEKFATAKAAFSEAVANLVSDSQNAYLDGILFQINDHIATEQRIDGLSAVTAYLEKIAALRDLEAVAETARDVAAGNVNSNLEAEYGDKYTITTESGDEAPITLEVLVAKLAEDPMLSDLLSSLRAKKNQASNDALTPLLEDYKAAANTVTQLVQTYGDAGASFTSILANGDVVTSFAAILDNLQAALEARDEAYANFDNYLVNFDAAARPAILNQLQSYLDGDSGSASLMNLDEVQASLMADKADFEDELTTLVEAYEAAAVDDRVAALAAIDVQLETLLDQSTIDTVKADVRTQLAIYVADPDAVSSTSVKDTASLQTALAAGKAIVENTLQQLAETYQPEYAEVVMLEAAYGDQGIVTETELGAIIAELDVAFSSAEAAFTLADADLSAELTSVLGSLYADPLAETFAAALVAYVDEPAPAAVGSVLDTLDVAYLTLAEEYEATLAPLLEDYAEKVTVLSELQELIGILTGIESLESSDLEAQLTIAQSAAPIETETVEVLEIGLAYKAALQLATSRVGAIDAGVAQAKSNLFGALRSKLGLLNQEDLNYVLPAASVDAIILALRDRYDEQVTAAIAAGEDNFRALVDAYIGVYDGKLVIKAQLEQELAVYSAEDSGAIPALVSQLEANIGDLQTELSNVLADSGVTVESLLEAQPESRETLETLLGGLELVPPAGLAEIIDIADSVLADFAAAEAAVIAIKDADFEVSELDGLIDIVNAIKVNSESIPGGSPERDLLKIILEDVLAGLDVGNSDDGILSRLGEMQDILQSSDVYPGALDLGISEGTTFENVQENELTTSAAYAELLRIYHEVEKFARDYSLARVADMAPFRATLESLERLQLYAARLTFGEVINIAEMIREYNAAVTNYYNESADPARLAALATKAGAEAKLTLAEIDEKLANGVVKSNGNAQTYSFTSYQYWGPFIIGAVEVSFTDPNQARIINEARVVRDEIVAFANSLRKDKATASKNLADIEVALAGYQETLEQLYPIIKALGPLLVDVLIDEDVWHNERDLEELLNNDSSLITSVRAYSNEYAVVTAPGEDDAETLAFESDGSTSTVTSTVKSLDYSSLLSLTGLNAKGIHADYDSIESFTLNTGASMDLVNVRDSLGQSNSTVFINTGEGDDEITVSDQDLTTDGIVSTLVIDAGTGNNLLYINDLNDSSADVITMTNGDRAGYTSVTGIAGGDVHYRGDYGQGVIMQAGQGKDDIRIEGLISDAHTWVLGGEEDDVITADFSAAAGASLTIKGELGDDLIDANLAGFRVTIEGNKGNDTIYGSVYNDLISGNDGNDLIIAGLGDDDIGGGLGNDAILGDTGQADYLDGVLIRLQSSDTNGGTDTVTVSGGDNAIIGGAGVDDITGAEGADIILGDNGVIEWTAEGIVSKVVAIDLKNGDGDTLDGGEGNNIIVGGTGGDRIDAGTQNDTILGDGGTLTFTAGILTRAQSTSRDKGDDIITVLNGSNVILAGAGSDAVTTGNGEDIILADNGLATFSAAGVIESVEVTDHINGAGDTLDSGNGDNIIAGGVGGDTIDTGINNDTILGDGGTLIFTAGVLTEAISTAAEQGDDVITVLDGDNVILAGAGSDAVTTGNGGDIILGDNGRATFSSTGVVESVEATDLVNGAADTLDSADGDNIIVGGVGGDTIDTGINNDTILGDGGTLTFTTGILSSAETNAGHLGADTITVADGDNIILAGGGDDDIATGNGRDTVLADSGEIVLANGLLERITASGASTGDDTLNLGNGDNIAAGGAGDDRIVTGDGNDWILGDTGEFLFDAGKLNSVITSNEGAGDDDIAAGAGDDVALGGAGADIIDGQDGKDTIFGDFVEVRIADNGLRDMQSILPTIGGSDTLTGGPGEDILVGGSDRDVFNGSLTEDIIVGNYARIQDANDFESLLVVSDPSNREVISASLLEIYNGKSRTPGSEYSASDVFFDYEYADSAPLRTDFALRLTPLLNGEELSRLSDAELKEFLRNLPLRPVDAGAGHHLAQGFEPAGDIPDNDAAPADGENGDGKSPDVKSTDVKSTEVKSTEVKSTDVKNGYGKPSSQQSDDDWYEHILQELKDNIDALLVKPEPGNTDAAADQSAAAQGTYTAPMVASLLLAAKVSRSRGWQVGGVGGTNERIQGDLSKLRKTQADRQFSIWKRD